jgi:hypothetical protein
VGTLAHAAKMPRGCETRDGCIQGQRERLRRADISREVCQNLRNFFATKYGSVKSRTQNGKTGNGISDNLDPVRTLPAGCQNNASSFDVGIERIAGENTEPATKQARKHNLAFGGDPGFHGKTILPPPLPAVNWPLEGYCLRGRGWRPEQRSTGRRQGMVEAAGVEPASEIHFSRETPCVVEFRRIRTTRSEPTRCA